MSEGMKKGRKSQWVHPELVIIRRVADQERVLSSCKNAAALPGSGVYIFECYISGCTSCEQIGTS